MASDNLDADPTIFCMPNTCSSEDDAGNTALLKFNLKKDGKINHKINLLSISYNDNVATLLSKNEFKVEYKDPKGVLKDFDQTISIKDQEKVRINYQKKKDQSIITSRREGEKKITQTVQGIKLLQLIIKASNLNINIK